MNLFKYHNISEGFDFQGMADEFNEHQDELENNNGLDTNLDKNIDFILDTTKEKFDVILNFLKKHLKYKPSGKPKNGEFIVIAPVEEFIIKLSDYRLRISIFDNRITFDFQDLSNKKLELFKNPLLLIVRKFFNKEEVKTIFIQKSVAYNTYFMWFTISKKELSFNELNRFFDEIFRFLNKINLL